MNEDSLLKIQDDLAERARNDEYCAHIEVVTERKGDLESEIKRHLGLMGGPSGQVGACIVMMSPVARVRDPNVSGPLLDVEISVRVLENVTLNTSTGGTGKPALAIARRLAALFHHYTPHGLGDIILSINPAIEPVLDPLAPLAYEVHFQISEDADIGEKLPTPTITVTGDEFPKTVTITCANSDASIFYSLNGTHPGPNAESPLYEGAVTVPGPCTVRAGAYLGGWIGSDIIQKNIE